MIPLGLGPLVGSTRLLGIHVADVASRVPAGSELYEWARVRGASAYNGGVASPTRAKVCVCACGHVVLSFITRAVRHTLSLSVSCRRRATRAARASAARRREDSAKVKTNS